MRQVDAAICRPYALLTELVELLGYFIDYANIIEELKDASLFDLYRLKSAINQQLENPQRLAEIKKRLRPGQKVTWRVAYTFLHPIIDVEPGGAYLIEDRT